MLKNQPNQHIVHGENIMIPCKLPSGAKLATPTRLNTEGKNIIIGHSETGHNHVLEAKKASDLEMYEENGVVYVKVNKPSMLVHRKNFDIHQPIEVGVGVYKINHKSEYDPFQGVMREIFD